MRPVNEKIGAAARKLQPTGPGDGGKALRKRLVRDLPALFPQRIHGIQRGDGVAELIIAEQCNAERPLAAIAEGLTVECGGAFFKCFRRGDGQRNLFRAAGSLHDLHNTLRLRVENGAAAGFDDAGLLLRDLFQRVTEDRGVLETDVGDDGGLRRGNDVGGVKLAAHADLQHHDVAVHGFKKEHAECGHQLKFRGMYGEGIGGFEHTLCQRDKHLIRDHFAVDLHSLVKAVKVRRGKQSRAVAGGVQDRGENRRGRAFAVRAGDMNELERLLRIAEER